MKRFFQPVEKDGSFKKPSLSPSPASASEDGKKGEEEIKEPLKFLTWNANSFLLRVKNNWPDFSKFVETLDPDVIAIQEVRMPAAGSKGAPKNPRELKDDTSSSREEKQTLMRAISTPPFRNYRVWWSLADSKYGGTALFVKKHLQLKMVSFCLDREGIYVLASEPFKIPWFDSIFADIGDEQSLAQSLSTFSGHLKQIIAIKAQSTSKSLVLLDEVGAGTNPLEGAALGMSILEGFAETGALLTIATTHHGELKTLKYSNDTFENACVEFDEVNLKPTYKILWGVPGRSNAINIAERLGLPQIVLDKARELYGTASAEINEVIVDMERFKQEFLQQTHESQDYLTRSRELHEKLLAANQRITENIVTQRYRKNQEISQAAAVARSNLHHKLRQFRASETQPSQNKNGDNTTDNGAYSVQYSQQSPQEKQIKIPAVGDRVHVSSLRKKATVLKVEASKGEIVVQAGNMQLRLKLSDVEAQ